MAGDARCLYVSSKNLARQYSRLYRQREHICADAVVARVEDLAERLGENPHMGRKVARSRLRRFPVNPYPYLIYYEVAGEAVHIIRIRQAARYRQAFQEASSAFKR